MHKLDLFKAALKSPAYRKRSWMISAFSLIRENEGEWQKDKYPYRIVQSPIGHQFYNPETDSLENIEAAEPGQPVFRFSDRIVLQPGDIANVTQETVTTIGNAYFNKACLTDCFLDKIPFQAGKVKINKLEEHIAQRLMDTPIPGGVRTSEYIYVDEYVKFANAVFHMTNYSQLCTWGLTEKAISPPPGIGEFKAHLIEKYKDRLHDPATLAIIDKALVEFDAKYLAGDPSMNFLLSDKSRMIVRKKLYLAYGGEKGLGDALKVDFIQRSLEEGWQIEKFPSMNNALRAGSFDRGSETQLGGVSFKELLRATSNISINQEDCGSKVGRKMSVEQRNINKLVGFSIITEEGPKFIKNIQEAGTYLGKVVIRRSPMYCVLDGNEYCKTCVGFNLASNPTGASMAVAEYGSVFLGLFMKAMHGKAIKTARLDYRKQIS